MSAAHDTQAPKLHPQTDYVLDLLVAAGHITREKAFHARDIAVEFAPRLQEKEGQPALSDRVDSFRQLLVVEIGASIDVSGDIARQEAQIDMADHLLVKFNELFPEAS